MRILVLTVILALSACSSSNGYSGRSAWAEINKENNRTKNTVDLFKTSTVNETEYQAGTIKNSSFPTSRPKYILSGKRINLVPNDKEAGFSNEYSQAPQIIDDIVFKKYELPNSPLAYSSNKVITKKLINPIKPVTDVILHEKYFSAAGSSCERKRISNNGDIVSRIICRYEDGKELNLSDLTI